MTMHYLIDLDADTCTITCTGQDLIKMESQNMVIYATPTPDGLANQLYLGPQHYPSYREDFLIADSVDFLEEMGVDTLDWEDLDEEEIEALEEEIGDVTITVPRANPRMEV